MKTLLKRIKHRIAHLTGWNLGQVEAWRDRNGRLMIGFRCECGQLEGIHPSFTER